ncbi:MAG TPA: hypothetical protein VII49_08490 [Rhizomicrobium sp.]
MPMTTNEAAETLRDITRTERRSASAYGYGEASPHLILWGLVWAVGYTFAWLRPQWNWTWLALAVLGSLGSFWIGARARAGKRAGYDWRFGATFAAVFLFIAALFAVMPPHTNNQAGAFFPILVALGYALVGIWARGWRMTLLGAAVAALTLFGFFALPAQFAPWMAVVGGGGLILGGFWLRSV